MVSTFERLPALLHVFGQVGAGDDEEARVVAFVRFHTLGQHLQAVHLGRTSGTYYAVTVHLFLSHPTGAAGRVVALYELGARQCVQKITTLHQCDGV